MNINLKTIAFIVLFISTCEGAFSQYANYYGSSEENIANSIVEFNNNFYLLGSTRLDAQSAFDYYLLRLHSNGAVAGRMVYGFPKHDVAGKVLVDEKGVFILGSAFDRGFQNVDMHLVKVDDDYNVEWEQFYGTEFQDQGFNIIRTSDGGFAMIGFSNSRTDYGDMFFVKADDKGQLEWQKFFGPAYLDYGFSLIENKTGEFILAGTENGFYNPTQTDFQTHDADILLVKTNSSGEQIWYKTFGGDGHDWAKDIIAAPDGGYLISGSTQSYGAGSFDFFLMKINEDGEQLWFKTFGGVDFDYGETLRLSEDNQIYILGTSASFSNDFKPDHLLIKTDLEGKQIWQNTYGGIGSDYSSSMICTKDSGCIFTGWTNMGDIGKKDIVLYKISKDGKTEIISEIISIDSVTAINIFPNPAGQQFSVELFAPQEYIVSFRLFNVQGREVLSKKISTNKITQFNTAMNSGTYLYRIEDKNAVLHTGKIILSN